MDCGRDEDGDRIHTFGCNLHCNLRHHPSATSMRAHLGSPDQLHLAIPGRGLQFLEGASFQLHGSFLSHFVTSVPYSCVSCFQPEQEILARTFSAFVEQWQLNVRF